MYCDTLSRLQYIDFNIHIFDITIVNHPTNFIIDYLTVPRKQNLLKLFISGSQEYEYNKQNFKANAGSIVLLPDNASYFARCTENKSYIGIWFDLLNKNGEKIQIKPDLYHSWVGPEILYIKLFHEINQCYNNPKSPIIKTKSLIYQLLSGLLIDTFATSNYSKMIEPAIHFIASHYRENLPVSLYAEQCNLSESYFRKKFRECVNMSPIEYRNELRFREARRLFKENYSIKEISYMVGFCDVNHFTKQYKLSTGVSLSKDVEFTL